MYFFQVSHLSTKRELEDSIENRLVQFHRRQQAMATNSIPSLLIEDFNVIPNRGAVVSINLENLWCSYHQALKRAGLRREKIIM